MDQQQKRWLMAPLHYAWIIVTTYCMEQNNHIERLQCCQNNAARIISKWPKFDHISPVLRELHWLPVEHRISYKILLLTYKALNGHAPQYLAALISKYVPPRSLRLEDQYLLNSPRWPFGILYPLAWSKLHLLTLSRPDLKLVQERILIICMCDSVTSPWWTI